MSCSPTSRIFCSIYVNGKIIPDFLKSPKVLQVFTHQQRLFYINKQFQQRGELHRGGCQRTKNTDAE